LTAELCQLINLIYNSAKISICNIYAPNDSQQQQKFLLTLNRDLMSHTEISNLIVGGDWNVTLQACDKKGGIPWRPTLYRDKLIAIMDEIGLIQMIQINPSFIQMKEALLMSPNRWKSDPELISS